MVDQTQINRATDDMSAAFLRNQSAPKTKTSPKKFYLPYNGATFLLPSGQVLVFVDGCLTTDIKEEIEEIEKAIASGAEIRRHPVPVIRSDSIRMKEVGSKKDERTARNVTSQTIANLAADSN